MYELGDQFKYDLEQTKANSECIYKGNHYRITVLTERLIRLEYSKDGKFVDDLSEFVINRNFPKPKFVVRQDDNTFLLTTSYFELVYRKEAPFIGTRFNPTVNLKIDLLNTEKVWYYNHPEARNYKANELKTESQKSLYSIDGFATLDDSKSMIIKENGAFENRNSNNIDIYVFLYNKDFYYCLNDYFKLTGYPPLIPRYALGLWWNKKDKYTEYELAHFIKKAELSNIPISLFTLDNWDDSAYSFKLEYRNPKGISDYLHNKNIRFGLTIKDPVYIKKNTPLFDKLGEYVPKDKNGNIPFDLLNERVIDAYLKILIHPLNNLGVDFYSIESYDQNNLSRLFLLKHYLMKDKANGERPLIIGRNAKVAAQRYPILYYGETKVDWNSLKEIPVFNSSASNLGISFWSHDCGGSTDGVEDSELFVRYVQLCVFSPILRLGSAAGKYYKREPWKWGLKPSTIATDFINLRYKLIPYLYTEAYKYHMHGKPLIEPIYYKNPELYDDDLYRSEYFLGSELFVSPIVTKKDYIMNRAIHKLYIPDGTWYDFFSGKKYTGDKKYVSFYRDEEYPVFVKAGTIIPMASNKYNNTGLPINMEINVFPGASNTYSIYEDDGVSNSYKSEEYLITNIEFLYKENNYSLTILPVKGKTGIAPKFRNYKIKFNNTKAVAKVITYVGSNKTSNYCYTDETSLIVEVNDVPTTSQLTVICGGGDIEYDNLKIIANDIVSIISDLPIKTIMKEKIDSIMFNPNYDIKKKRIEIRKLRHGKNYLEPKYIDLFLKLLEYIDEV